MPITIEDLKPVEDRILVIPDEAEEVTKGGIVLPQNAQEKPSRGTVVAVGPGKVCEMTGQYLPMPVKADDTIYYSKFGGNSINIPDLPEIRILTPAHVLLVVKDGSEG